MEEEIKRISEEKLDYYRNNIFECPVDILRILYAEKEESEKYLYDAYKDAGKKMFEYAEKCEKLERQIRIKDGYCDLIWSLGVDYDGCNTIGSLKSLIDELVDYAKKACRNDDKYAIGENLAGKYYNILYEEVEKPKED